VNSLASDGRSGNSSLSEVWTPIWASEGAGCGDGRLGRTLGKPQRLGPSGRERCIIAGRQHREQTTRFDHIAEAESRSAARDRFVDLARQYRGLAARLEAKLRPKKS
jgi:hypothetical protein